MIPANKEWKMATLQASEIAQQLEQELNSAHLLLSMFLFPNRAESVLLEYNTNEDVILSNIQAEDYEDSNTVKQILTKSQEFATSCDSTSLGILHMLNAMVKIECLANRLLRLSIENFEQFERKIWLAMHEVNAETTPSSALRELHTLAPQETDEQQLQSALEALESGVIDSIRFPILSRLGRNLTQLAREEKLDPLIGREKEMEMLVSILRKRRSNNPCLVGYSGVGKTAIVEGLALVQDSYPEFTNKVIVQLDVASLLAGTQLRGSLAEKMVQLRKELRETSNQVVIFIDEIHTIVKAGAAGDNAFDIGNDLKVALGRGEFSCIGATTPDDFEKYILQDPALTRRFHLLQIDEPDKDETIEILEKVIPLYSQHYGIEYAPKVANHAYDFGARYIFERCFPAKAIDLLDLAGSLALRAGTQVVERVHIVHALSKLIAIPEEHLFLEENQRILQLEEHLRQEIVGNSFILKQIAGSIYRGYAGLNDSQPISSFLFLGPPNSGKTEITRTLADFLFYGSNSLLRFDLSEYGSKESIYRLIGAIPGYVGYERGGELTEALRKNSHRVLLIENIDKAEPNIISLFTSILEHGIVISSQGHRISFRDAVIVFTSTLGGHFYEQFKSGYGHDTFSKKELVDEVITFAQSRFAPDFWESLDEHLVFTPLEKQEQLLLLEHFLKKSSSHIFAKKRIQYSVSPQLLSHLTKITQQSYRSIRPFIRRSIESKLAKEILSGSIELGSHVIADLDSDKNVVFVLDQDVSIPQPPVSTPKSMTKPQGLHKNAKRTAKKAEKHRH